MKINPLMSWTGGSGRNPCFCLLGKISLSFEKMTWKIRDDFLELFFEKSYKIALIIHFLEGKVIHWYGEGLSMEEET